MSNRSVQINKTPNVNLRTSAISSNYYVRADRKVCLTAKFSQELVADARFSGLIRFVELNNRNDPLLQTEVVTVLLTGKTATRHTSEPRNACFQ